MPHIDLPPDVPGILSLFAFRPESALPLNLLAETLLRAPSPLARGERELIAAYVSSLNDCVFCFSSHAAFAAAQLDDGYSVVDAVRESPASANVSDKLRALLELAGRVQQGGRHVRPEDVEKARSAGASDVEIHDAVLIAAAFCMYNRYVDGLATIAPKERSDYDRMACQIVENGYASAPPR